MALAAIIWLRNDLRLHDHMALSRALEHHPDSAAMLYCVDPRHWREIGLGWEKTGPYRTTFLIETLQDLRAQLRAKGSDLIVLRGHPEHVIPEFVQRHGVEFVAFHEEATDEEMASDEAVVRALEPLGVKVERCWGSTLVHLDDLPFDPQDLPDVFTHFRKQVEKVWRVRDEFPTPEHMPALPAEIDPGEMLTLEECGQRAPEVHPQGVMRFEGGERAGLERLRAYFWEHDRLKVYKQTRNGMLKANESSKYSPWLANGSLSPRRVYHEVRRYERERQKNESTYWMIFELLWRDYFRFLGLAVGTRLFKLRGIQDRELSWSRDEGLFWKWAHGETGVPFVDAHMRELNETGFMSNRGRQNVGSFLAKNLQIDWRWGASYFESVLVDYDPTSNWGNWQYVAGVGNDPRDRRFNVVGQGKRYDDKGDYVRRWCPELSELPGHLIHSPWEEDPRVLKSRYGVQLGVDYPQPMVPMHVRSKQPNSRKRGRGRSRR